MTFKEMITSIKNGETYIGEAAGCDRQYVSKANSFLIIKDAYNNDIGVINTELNFEKCNQLKEVNLEEAIIDTGLVYLEHPRIETLIKESDYYNSFKIQNQYLEKQGMKITDLMVLLGSICTENDFKEIVSNGIWYVNK